MLRWIQTLAAIAVIATLDPAAVLAQGYGGEGGNPQQTQQPTGSVDLRAQLRTASTHATNAANSETLPGVRSHLMHVVNCLEGARGRNYFQNEANPCQGQGNGVLVDLRSAQGGGTWMAVAESANELAVRGAKMSDLASARATARGVAALLSTASDSIR
jgi:hypothetical protein